MPRGIRQLAPLPVPQPRKSRQPSSLTGPLTFTGRKILLVCDGTRLDRLAILVSGDGFPEFPSAFPTLASGTGERWRAPWLNTQGLGARRGLWCYVVDTPAATLDPLPGACTLLEQKLEPPGGPANARRAGPPPPEKAGHLLRSGPRFKHQPPGETTQGEGWSSSSRWGRGRRPK
ncbi:hypothetical protein GWK47_044192 [Chionoecetes opilio]|uniref:Uncharacterized protein n=1 Tax=Chionoecetes opilio TaxID=41210 RepID=A0A8J5CVS8_CHIOP|nr:hypothetical protein GWK47_044192 [Chionoecetes opilio]